MTIYATPFVNATKAITGPSADSGFETLDQVVEMLGQPKHRSRRTAIYDGIAYSDFVFCIDGPGTTG